MTFSLSKALRIVCYIWGACALVSVIGPFIGLALHHLASLRDRDALVWFYGGVFFGFIAGVFYLLSRLKLAKQPAGHPVISSILWVVVVAFGLTAIGMLYSMFFQ